MDHLRRHTLSEAAELWCLGITRQTHSESLRDWLVSHIPNDILNEPDSSDFRRIAKRLRVLMDLDPPAAWHIAEKPFLSRANALVKFAEVTDLRHESPSRLVEAMTLDQIERVLRQLPQLYITAASWRPPSDPLEVAATLLRTCANRAKAMGSREAVDMFERLPRDPPPGYLELPYDRREAEETWLRDSWSGKRPTDLHTMLQRQGAWTIDSAQELFEFVLELLEQIQHDLMGEISLLKLLWCDKREPGASRKKRVKKAKGQQAKEITQKPRREPVLQAFIKNQMTLLAKHRPLVMDREVQIGPRGDSDFLVTAVTPGSDLAKVAIEIKLQDHKAVATAMKHQLVNGYMTDATITHGVYLVGWYASEEWTPRHWQLGEDIDTAQAKLEKQAEQLKAQHTPKVCDLAAFVLDCRIPPPPSQRPRTDTSA